MNESEPYARQLIRADDALAPVHHVLIAISDMASGHVNSLALGNNGSAGGLVRIQDPFRTGSITKMFTAVLILQLCESGQLSLQAPASTVLPAAVATSLQQHAHFPKALNIAHLLQHRSGLPDYLSPESGLISRAFSNQSRQWLPEELLNDFLSHLEGLPHPPGTDFLYADTNYLLLGMIAEYLTGSSLAALMNVRIIETLNLQNTWFEGTRPGQQPLTHYYGPHAMNDVNFSFDWGGGGIISTAHDLSVFLHALHKGRLFRNLSTLQAMTDFFASGEESLAYGLGIQQFTYKGIRLQGHISAYGAAAFYHPADSTAFVLQLDQAAAVHKTQWLLRKLVQDRYLKNPI